MERRRSDFSELNTANETDGVQKFLISTPRAKALLQVGSKQDQDMERVM